MQEQVAGAVVPYTGGKGEWARLGAEEGAALVRGVDGRAVVGREVGVGGVGLLVLLSDEGESVADVVVSGLEEGDSVLTLGVHLLLGTQLIPGRLL